MEKALRNRLTFGSIMLVALFGLLWLDHSAEHWTYPAYSIGNREYGIGGIGLLALLLVVLPFAVYELAQLFAMERVKPSIGTAILGCGMIILHGFMTQFPFFERVATSTLAFIVVFVMLIAALRRALKLTTHDAILSMAGTVLATLYLGGLAWFLISLRVKHGEFFEGSTSKILMVLLTVKFTDIGAYFGGRKFGKHKLIPWLSPGKTCEGLLCGMLVAGIVGAICAHWITHLLPPKGFVFGMIIGCIGQMGDLLESLMKRDAEVKDSGRAIPGFGGILDVIDSPLLAAPFAYLLFSFFQQAT